MLIRLRDVLFVLCIFVILFFPLWFRGLDRGSDSASSWSLLGVYFSVLFYARSLIPSGTVTYTAPVYRFQGQTIDDDFNSYTDAF